MPSFVTQILQVQCNKEYIQISSLFCALLTIARLVTMHGNYSALQGTMMMKTYFCRYVLVTGLCQQKVYK